MMLWYVKSIDSPSIIFLAELSALTLKPRIMAFTATAKLASDSDIPPTPLETILTFASSVPRSFNADTIASEVPTTSVLTIIFKTFLDSWPIVSKIFILASLCLSCFLSFSLLILNSAISLACFSFSTT